jgi:hypothetical protein
VRKKSNKTHPWAPSVRYFKSNILYKYLLKNKNSKKYACVGCNTFVVYFPIGPSLRDHKLLIIIICQNGILFQHASAQYDRKGSTDLLILVPCAHLSTGLRYRTAAREQKRILKIFTVYSGDRGKTKDSTNFPKNDEIDSFLSHPLGTHDNN